jgi:EmrB/QacA subfamily drug resistance transporter
MEGTEAVTAKGRWWALAAVSLATLMTYLDNNVINVAIPTIQRDLHLSVTGLEWIVSSYLLVLAGLLLVGGRLADVYGRRRVFLTGLAIFTLSSLTAGLAGSGGVLIGARAVQGLGAALLMPATLAIIGHAFTDVRERTAAIGIWSAIGALGLALGPVVGGLISQHIHWGWIFLINVPIGVVTFAIAIPSIAESRADLESRRLDVPGLVTSAVALTSLTYALIEGNDRGWTSGQILGAFGPLHATAVFLHRAASGGPMVQTAVFRACGSGGTAVMMIWAFGVLGRCSSLYLRGSLGFSPTKAGLAFVPMALSVVLASMVAARVTSLIGGHRTVAAGVLLMVVGLLLFARLGAGASFAALIPGFAVFGIGIGLMNVPLTTAVLDGLPAEHAGIASALLNNSREVAGLLGITVIGAVLRAQQRISLRGGASAPQAFLDGYHAGLWVTIGLLAAGVVVSYVSLRPRQRPEPGVLAVAGEEIEAEGVTANAP